MSGETCAPPFDYWIIETMKPKDLGFSQEGHAGERFHPVLTAFQIILRERSELK